VTATSSAGAQATAAGRAAWETTRTVGTQGAAAVRDIAGQGYDVARRAARAADVAEMPLAALLVGGAIGYAAAYLIHASDSRRRVASTQARRASEPVIATLNGLVEISKDGELGFRTSADAVQNPQTKAFLDEAAARCARGAAELQRKVRSLGGDPEQSGSPGGSLHRAWVGLKSRIAGMDDRAILNEVERGEDVAKAAYAEALETRLPPEVRSLLERQYQSVRQNHDRVRDLRDAAR
jgi:uncharacterized protein (TIGR02284 family)